MMQDYRGPPHQQYLHRKPVPSAKPAAAHAPAPAQVLPDGIYQTASHLNPTHNRTRTSSSSIFPNSTASSTVSSSQATYPTSYQTDPYKPYARRTLSNGTTSTSTTGTGGGAMPGRTTSNVSISLRRTTSSRSSNSPGGYVALMRKQKATVWCDRAQHEDPRLMAQQKAAKMRATMEVIGGAGRTTTHTTASTGSSSMMSRSKIRHHNKPVALGYTPASLVGGVSSVPMRLSASEVGDDGNRADDGDARRAGDPHRRSGSGVSSLAANRRHSPSHITAANRNNSVGQLSQAETMRTSSGSSPENSAELGDGGRAGGGYFAARNHTQLSGGSASSPDKDERYRGGGQQQIQRAPSPERNVKSPDDLRRRGSVDDRTMTLSAGRLFVANPDLSD